MIILINNNIIISIILSYLPSTKIIDYETGVLIREVDAANTVFCFESRFGLRDPLALACSQYATKKAILEATL